MNQRRKIIIGLPISVVIIFLLIFYGTIHYPYFLLHPNNVPTALFHYRCAIWDQHFVPNPDSGLRFRIVTTLDYARQTSGLSLPVPTFLPDDLNLKKIMLYSNNSNVKYLQLLYAPKSASISNSTLRFADSGFDDWVLISYSWVNSTYGHLDSVDEYLNKTSAPEAEPLSLNGTKAVFIDIPNAERYDLIFNDADVQIGLHSCWYDKSDLIRMGHSIMTHSFD